MPLRAPPRIKGDPELDAWVRQVYQVILRLEQGMWVRVGTTLSPAHLDDSIDLGAGSLTTTGDISADNFI